MNPPLGGSPEPHLIEEHKVLLSPRVCGLTDAFRNPNTWAAIAASALNPDSRFRRRTGAVTTGRCFAVAMGSSVHAPGSEREAGSPLASGEVSRVRALPITHAAILCSTPAPEQKVRITLLMVSSSPGAFPTAHVDRPAFRTSDKRNGPSAWHAERRPPFNDASWLTAQSALVVFS